MSSEERPLPPQCNVVCVSGRCRHLAREGEEKCPQHLRAEAEGRLCAQCGAGRLRKDNKTGFCAKCRRKNTYRYAQHRFAMKAAPIAQ